MSSNSETSLLTDDPAQSSTPSKKRSRPSSPDPQPASLRQRLPSPDHGLAHQTINPLLAGSLPDARHGSSSSSSSSSFQDRAADLPKKIAETEKEIEETKEAIKKVGKQIDDIEVEIKNESDPVEKKQLREERKQLRKKEEQLREEKIKLLDEKKDLRTALLQLGQNAPSSSSGPPPFDLQRFQAAVEEAIATIQTRLTALATGDVPFLLPYNPSADGRYFLERFFSETTPYPLVSSLPDLDPVSPGLTNDYLYKQVLASPNRISIVLDLSGSGKTRHMYEALCLRIGFYFVGNTDNGGSEDLKTLCGNIVKIHKLRPDIVNREFAENQFKMLTFWRWSIYLKIREQFEKLGKSLSPKQWLLMQAYPEAVLGEDIFSDLLPLPMDVRSLPRYYLNTLLSDIPPGTPVFLDEAQCLPTDTIFTPFSGNGDDEARRMILSPLVSAIRRVPCLRMVIAGAGLSLKSIPEFPNRMVSFDKRPPLEITNLGGFHTREQIASCLNTFKFADLAGDAESVQYLFDRVRGRHRFLVTVLTTLSQRDTHDHQTLQEVCREYIEKMTTSERVGSLYAQIRNVTLGSGPSSRSPAIQLRRLQTAEYQHYFDDLSELVLHFRYYSLPLAPPTDAQAILLEYALCRFVKGSNSVSIDEPLVVLAYTRCIEPKLSQSLLYRNILNSPTSAAKGNWFEFFLLRPLLRLLSGVPLDKMDLHVVGKPTPKLFRDLFRDAVAASSSSSSSSSSNGLPPFLSWSFTVEGFDPLDEPACLSQVNRTEDGYDILEYFQRAGRPPAFYPHFRAGPDGVVILRFEYSPTDGSLKVVIRVPLFIQFKSGRASIRAELKNLNPSAFYPTSSKEADEQSFLDRRARLCKYIQETFEGRWLGLLILGKNASVRIRQNGLLRVESSGVALATTQHRFLSEEYVNKLDQIRHLTTREGPLRRHS